MRWMRQSGRPARALVPLLAAALLLWVGAAGEARAGAAFAVDSTADAHDASPGDGTCATATVTCTLRAALEEADALAGADTVSVPAGLYTLSLGQLRVTSSGGVTVTGAGALSTALQGGGSDRVLEVAPGAAATLADLEVTGGTTTDYGGGVKDEGTLSLQDVDVDNNQAVGSYGGGGIAVFAGTLHMTRGSVVSNTAANGGVNGGGGGVVLAGSNAVTDAGENASFDGTTISANTALGAGGIAGVYGALTLTDAHVDDNGTPGGVTCGFGVLAGGTLTMSGGSVNGNCGGGITLGGMGVAAVSGGAGIHYYFF